MLWGVLAAIVFLNYQTWLHDYAPPVAPTPQAATAGSSPTAPANGKSLGDTLPEVNTSAPVPAPQTSSTAPGSAPTAPATSIPETPSGNPGAGSAPPLHVVTDVLDIAINLKGGELERADLKAYPLRKDTPNIPVRLLSYEPPPTLYLLQSGLTGSGSEAAPTHLATWKSEQQDYVLAPNAAELRVPLTWTDGKGLSVTKTFIFKRGQYAIALDYDVKNDSGEPRKLASYAQFLRHWEHASRSYFNVET
jgi:YidC/Oxa1 family membrane protein insertase